MTRILISAYLLIVTETIEAQKVESIHFNLYTDSLKKGTHNYINVDGKLSNGTWLPLTSNEILFTSSECSFSGNELIIPPDCKAEKIKVKAVLKSNTSLWLEKTIWIKTLPDPELPGNNDIIKQPNTIQTKEI